MKYVISAILAGKHPDGRRRDPEDTRVVGGVDQPGLRLVEARRGGAGALEACGLGLLRFAAPVLALCCSASRTASAVADLRPYIGGILMPR